MVVKPQHRSLQSYTECLFTQKKALNAKKRQSISNSLCSQLLSATWCLLHTATRLGYWPNIQPNHITENVFLLSNTNLCCGSVGKPIKAQHSSACVKWELYHSRQSLKGLALTWKCFTILSTIAGYVFSTAEGLPLISFPFETLDEQKKKLRNINKKVAGLSRPLMGAGKSIDLNSIVRSPHHFCCI